MKNRVLLPKLVKIDLEGDEPKRNSGARRECISIQNCMDTAVNNRNKQLPTSETTYESWMAIAERAVAAYGGTCHSSMNAFPDLKPKYRN